MRQIERDELEPLATGAWILGTGGGGSPYLAYLNMRRLYAEGTRVTLMDPARPRRRRPGRGGLQHGRAAGRPGTAVRPAFAAKPVRMMEEYLGRHFRAVMSVEIGGGNAFQPLLVAALPACRWSTPMRWAAPSRSADDQLRDRRPAAVPAHAGRHPRQRGHRRPRRELEMDGADQPQDLHRGRLDRRHLQGAAHRRRGEGARHPAHHHAGDRARPRGAARPAARTRTRSRPRWRPAHGKLLFRGKVADVQRRATEGFLRGTRPVDGLDDDRGARLRGRVPERMRGRLARRSRRGDDARPDLRARQRVGRGDRHRKPALRPAGQL